ncbi:hypothetical protein D3C73_1349860 [compost metagenome]
MLDDDTDVEAHQRPHVSGQAAVGRSNQNALPNPGHAHADLLDTRVERPRGGIDTFEQLDLFSTAEHVQRVVRGIQGRHVLATERLDSAILAGAGNRTRRTGC